MQTLPLSIIIVLCSALTALAGLYLVRKYVKPELISRHNLLAGNILAVIGTLNAVLLGLVIVEAQSRFQQARLNEAAESSLIADMRMYAEYISEPTRTAIDKHVENYVKIVRDVEWDEGPTKQPNPHAVKEFHCLWNLVCDYAPKTEKEQNLQASMLSSLAQSFDMRRLRITSGRHGMPEILWAVLIACSSITVICSYFLEADNFKMHAMLVVLLSTTLSMGILVVLVLGNPYVGDWKIRPEQFLRISTSGFPITGNSKPFDLPNKHEAPTVHEETVRKD